jgi:arylsulfatase A-like enzyme
MQPFETPYSWVVHVDLDDDSIERVRELYAAEITFIDEWVGRLMNKLADEKLLDETVIYYMSDHGLTLGESGVMGKAGARAQWPIYHVPALIRHPEGKLAGQTSDYFASTHDVPRTLLSFMGVRAPGMMEGEDLSVLFEGREPPPRAHFTSCYDNYLLCGDGEWFLLSDSEGRRKRLYDKRNDPDELHNVAAEHPEIVDRLWKVLEDEAGGTLPQFGSSGARTVIGG